jgi:hypothetical protein
MRGKTKGLFLSPKSNHQKGGMKSPVSTKVKPNPKLAIVILSVFVFGSRSHSFTMPK